MDEDLLGSTLSNFKNTEVSCLTDYLDQIDDQRIPAEVRLYNFSRFSRFQDITKLLVFFELFKLIRDVHGDIIEFGVHNGGTLFNLAHCSEILEPRNYTRKIWGVDVFGEVEVEGVKTLRTDNIESLRRSVAIFNNSCFMNQFKKINLIEGSVRRGCDTLLGDKSHVLPAMIIVHVGRYADEQIVISEGWRRLVKGGIMVFGSLNCADTPQCTKALLSSKLPGASTLKRMPFATKYSWLEKQTW